MRLIVKKRVLKGNVSSLVYKIKQGMLVTSYNASVIKQMKHSSLESKSYKNPENLRPLQT